MTPEDAPAPEDDPTSEDAATSEDVQNSAAAPPFEGAPTPEDASTLAEAADERDDGPADTPPDAVLDEVERLTRLARNAVDDAEAAAYREAREEALAEHDYTARVREEETGAVLVCHPTEWLEDGVVRTERIEDLDRGIERRLSGPGEPESWERVEAHNRAIATAVEEEHGPIHGANAHALADFMGNHYAKTIEEVTRDELREFLTEYYPRNAFPSDDERACIEESLRLVDEATDADLPVEE